MQKNCFFMTVLTTLIVGCTHSTMASPTPVEELDLNRYQGKWHQLAAIPASFQKSCVGNTTAEYSLLHDGLIKVVNSCDKKNGQRRSSEARARVNKDYGQPSTLEVTFVKLFGWAWFLAGDYWVIDINSDYTTAIVGHPEYDYGWILSKKETLSMPAYNALHSKLAEQGYDPCRFIMSNTPSQEFAETTSLCHYIVE